MGPLGLQAHGSSPPPVWCVTRLAVVAIVLLSHQLFAQARVVSAPSEPSLLNLTTGWARASTLGDLRDLRVSGDYLELRVWHG